ncbi:MAG: iron-sulfur cluster assembly scaffold protein [Candidatus Pacebacteria bacterium]|nr:iron-sulfur cluster assembly scaffold protein [Candidatus Paceibacterota bacterium]
MQYSNKVLKFFKRPKHSGQMKNPDTIGTAGSLHCGDTMAIYLKIAKNKKNQEFIKDVKYKTFGCVAAIASSEALARIIKKKTLKECLELKNNDLVYELHGLPDIKIHCSLIGIDALTDAIYLYYSKNHPELITKELQDKEDEINRKKQILETRYKE